MNLKHVVITPYGVRDMTPADAALYDRAPKRVNGQPDRRTRAGRELDAAYKRVRDEARAEFGGSTP